MSAGTAMPAGSSRALRLDPSALPVSFAASDARADERLRHIPVIVFLTQPSWSFLLFPTLVGALVLVTVALIYNNATRDARYPKYW